MTAYRLFAAAALSACLTPAFAGTDINVGRFSGVEVHSGASVVLRHGPVQKVTMIRGDLNVSRITLNGSSLNVEGCVNWLGCPRNYKLQVEIVTPGVTELEAHGGGAIRAEGDFPRQKELDVQAHGGGSIDARAIAADAVKAEAHGGGSIRVHANNSLHAEAHGGGAITFAGNPGQVDSSAHGGGAISRD